MMPSNVLSQTDQAILDLDLGFVAQRVAEEAGQTPDARSDAYIAELKRFFMLIARADEPLAMISPRIDAFWHAFIQFTPQYRAFCARTFGFYADHLPRTERTPVPLTAIGNFIESYRATFGQLPDLWFDGVSECDAIALRAGTAPAGYRWSGWVPPTYTSP